MDIEQQIFKAENDLFAAILNKNLALLDNLYDEDYVFTSTQGEIWGKEKALADFADPRLSIEGLSVSELEVVVRQDTAVVTGFAHVEGREGDNPLTGKYRFTRTWRFSDSNWRVIAVQTSHIDS